MPQACTYVHVDRAPRAPAPPPLLTRARRACGAAWVFADTATRRGRSVCRSGDADQSAVCPMTSWARLVRTPAHLRAPPSPPPPRRARHHSPTRGQHAPAHGSNWYMLQLPTRWSMHSPRSPGARAPPRPPPSAPRSPRSAPNSPCASRRAVLYWRIAQTSLCVCWWVVGGGWWPTAPRAGIGPGACGMVYVVCGAPVGEGQEDLRELGGAAGALLVCAPVAPAAASQPRGSPAPAARATAGRPPHAPLTPWPRPWATLCAGAC